MSPIQRICFAAIANCVLFCGAAVVVSAKPSLQPAVPLEGDWTVTLTPDGGDAKAMQDKLTFKDRKLRCEMLAAAGFEPIEYRQENRPEQTVYLADGKSRKDESIVSWILTVNGPKLSGVLTWTKKDGTFARYTIDGAKAP